MLLVDIMVRIRSELPTRYGEIVEMCNARYPTVQFLYTDAVNFARRYGLVLRTVTNSQMPLRGLKAVEENRAVIVLNVRTLMHNHTIPLELVFNMDETSVLCRKRANRTLAPIGSKRVAVKSAGTIHGCTVALAVSANGERLPAQVIHHGKTKRCLPSEAAISATKRLGHCISGTSLDG
jgi:hypothetical protein